MSAVYPVVKQLCISVLSGFAPSLDIPQHYGAVIKAQTKLSDLGFTLPAVLCNRTNMTFAPAIGVEWETVGPIDFDNLSNIGDYIKLVCRHGSITIPPGEPT